MRKRIKRSCKGVLGSNITFVVVTIMIITVISFCIARTVISQSNIGTQEIECYYREKEQKLLKEMKERLAGMGFVNSGVTLTRVVDEVGTRDYTFTIHHGKIDKMSEKERNQLGVMLLEGAVIDENCTFYHEFLLYE